MLSPDILRLILGYLDFESKQKRAVLVCKQWFEIIRDNSALSGHLVLWPPTGNVTADEINDILTGWSGLTTLEIPIVNDMEKIKYAQCKLLQKVYVRTNIELNFWCHVNKICFDPKVIQTPTSDQALKCSVSLIVKWEGDLTIASWDPFGKMKNLETLTILFNRDVSEFWPSDFIKNLQKYCTQVSTIEIVNSIPSSWDGYIDVDQLNLDKFKNLETLVIKNCKLFYSHGTPKPIHIKELHHINERECFLNENYISKYPQHFLSLEKLVFDQSGPPFSMVWKIETLTKFLYCLASFKYIHLKITSEVLLTDNFWFLDETELANLERPLASVDMDVNEEDFDVEMLNLNKNPLTVEERHQILEKALEIIREKFPIESEIELVDGRSGLSIVKEKWKQAQIQQVSEFKMAEILSLIRKQKAFRNQ